MKNYHFLVIAIVFGVLVFFFNLFLVDYRIQDVNTALTVQGREGQDYKTLGMVGKLELIRARMESREEGEESIAYEVRLQTLLNFEEQSQKSKPPQTPIYLEPVKAVVNLLRWSFGKKALGEIQSSQTLEKLAKAYLKERSRRYSEALGLYLDILNQEKLGDEVDTQVRLHVGFCQILLRQFDKAREQLQLILNRPSSEESRILALTLLQYLEEFARWTSSSPAQVPSALDRARERFLMMDYTGARKLLEEFQTQKTDPQRLQESYFYLARTLEESGETDAAVQTYKKAIFLDPGSEWSDKSRRRQYVLGEFYLQKPQIADLVRPGLARDEAFLKALSPMAALNRKMIQASLQGRETPEETLPDPLILFIETDFPSVGLFSNGTYLGISPVFLTPVPDQPITVEGFGPGIYGKLSFIPPRTSGILSVRLNLTPVPTSYPQNTSLVAIPAEKEFFPRLPGLEYPGTSPRTAEVKIPPWKGPLLFPQLTSVSVQALDALRNLEILAKSRVFPKGPSVEEARVLSEQFKVLMGESPLSQRSQEAYRQLKEMEEKETALSKEIKNLQEKKDQNAKELSTASTSGYAWAGWAGMGGAVLGLGTMGGALWVGNDLYTQYKNGTTSAVKELRGSILIAQALAIAGAVVGGVSLAAGTWFFILDNEESQKKKARDEISRELDAAIGQYNQHLGTR